MDFWLYISYKLLVYLYVANPIYFLFWLSVYMYIFWGLLYWSIVYFVMPLMTFYIYCMNWLFSEDFIGCIFNWLNFVWDPTVCRFNNHVICSQAKSARVQAALSLLWIIFVVFSKFFWFFFYGTDYSVASKGKRRSATLSRTFSKALLLQIRQNKHTSYSTRMANGRFALN